jgi:enediyne polyketide synthase
VSAQAIAIVGLACRYPDAPDLQSFWDLVRGGRLAFRPIPPGQLDLGDLLDADRGPPDNARRTRAALIEGWELDHAAYQPPGARGHVDPAHFLALDTAARALRDAGFPGGNGLDRQRAGVTIGNTVTSELRRAATLRLYWPHIRGALATALATTAGPPGEWRNEVLETAAQCFVNSLPEVTAGSLADGPAGSIAGRICARFDFQGGGHPLTATCSSSLVAVAAACAALATGDLDFALAGGVDIGLDPFDLVAFARAGALATNEMRIYDAAPTGFLLGEGCGHRRADARKGRPRRWCARLRRHHRLERLLRR